MKSVGTKIFGGLAVTVVLGFGAYNFAMYKDMLTFHTQGETISCERVDTYDEALAYAKIIANTGLQRFGRRYGCSYHYVIIGKWIFKMQEDLAISAHTADYNTRAIGLMLCRTDDEEFNKLTMYTARLKFIELHEEHEFVLAVFHSDVSKIGKPDPQEFKPWIIMLGMRFDGRDEAKRLNIPLRKPDLRWKQI